MTHLATIERGRFTIVCDAVAMSCGKYAPVYKILLQGDPPVTIKRQAFPSPGPNFHRAQQAIEAAARMANEWLASQARP